MSPPVMLLQEVLILGAVLGNADRVVSAVAEDTVTVGTLLPATTQDERDREPTTSGHSSWLSPGKLNRPVMDGLVGVKNDAPSGWEVRGVHTRDQCFQGSPGYGVKVVLCGLSHHGKAGGQKPLNVR